MYPNWALHPPEDAVVPSKDLLGEKSTSEMLIFWPGSALMTHGWSLEPHLFRLSINDERCDTEFTAAVTVQLWSSPATAIKYLERDKFSGNEVIDIYRRAKSTTIYSFVVVGGDNIHHPWHTSDVYASGIHLVYTGHAGRRERSVECLLSFFTARKEPADWWNALVAYAFSEGVVSKK